MQPTHSLVILALCGAMAAPSMASEAAPPLTGCAAKQQDIRQQIDHAKAAGNSNQVAGLQKALSESTRHCTPASLQKERENKVLKARQEVAQRQADLDKAMKKGDADKINTRKDKLAQARKELQQATDDLER
ncbi:DUF1090 domain-containing protein [Pseudomonas sp. HR96]|uniref:DUF1090 domain-containing protein n=1 Tax=Pseudomonas sp. HR96 TaxID=1027966 RepID=UPI002A7637E0|nr:DUF1090 domain-containing protein [Pseudomonas sp. HR96]WPP00250.1 DUF1090 domain-containing protein [Pseudomonas sp. HR96]